MIPIFRMEEYGRIWKNVEEYGRIWKIKKYIKIPSGTSNTHLEE